eukprot:TCALIF_04778-PA protein Name:"Similar to Pxn Peroxidasin (Drosophila melanogaster)" AED:0.07 eAED:0.07 QI:0/0/0/0.33/1/1/3/0/685
MKAAFLVLSLWATLALANDLKAVVEKAQEELTEELHQKVKDGLTTPESKRRKFTPGSRAMKDLNSLVGKSVAILEQEGVKGYPGGGQDPVLDICRGIGPDCEEQENRPFRTFNGTCNNLRNSLWGSILTPFTRWATPAYQNGIDTPRGGIAPFMMGRKKRSPQSVSGFLDPPLVKEVSPILSVPCSGFPAGVLPNPRLVSSTFHPHQDIPDGIATHMVAIMGQFLDHDITFTPEEEAEGCCCGSTEEACFPIKVNRNDPFFNRHKVGCLDFTRSMAFCEHFRRLHREQINGITAFVDASNVYGSTKARADSLRAFSRGSMEISTEGGYEMLPIINGTYHAGDTRAMENPALASMHTLFLREHNRIAEQLHNMDPSLDDEEIYQRTRRIVSAEMQNVVYGGYLPIVLGSVAMAQHDLVVSPNPSIYKPHQDPSISNVFATAAYRFGHSMIQGVVNMVNEVTRALEKKYRLQDNFFSPAHYLSFNGAGMEKILGGLVNQQAQTSDRFVINDVTNHLFPEHGASFGSDLVARNIQRGRDHGLASYNAYRELCGRRAPCSWDDRPADISSSNWRTLKELYNHPNDIDVFVGGLAERPSQDGLTGHTFQCIKSKQFQFLKYGDRYFFTHANQAGSFKQGQMLNLLQRTLGDIICDNTQIKTVRKDVFDATSPLQSCTDRNQLEIGLFEGL